MKNIIIKKTIDFGSKGELLVEKGGRIVTEIVDPKSLRQIINYAKDNFYNLKNASLDEDDFSFEYNNYKITFEFYRSYDFIRNNIRNLKNEEKVKKLIFKNAYDLDIDFVGYKLELKEYKSYSEIMELLSKIRTKKSEINYHIKGNNLYINIDGIIIELNDYKKFASNKNFSYIFEDIKKKNFKVVKNTILAGTLSIISAISVASFAISAQAENSSNNEEEKNKIETNTLISETEEELTETKVFVDSEPESLVETTKVEAAKEEKITYQTLLYDENDEYEELGIGTLPNDEKLLTAKRLYFDLIESYAEKYGVDPYLMLAVATQERGIHSNKIDEKGAIGLMQIQVDIWLDESLTVFDFEQNKEITINFTMDKISNLEGNIESACAIMQHYEKRMNGNKFASIQSYNNGPSTVEAMISQYSYYSGKSENEILFGNDIGWYDYRSSKNPGDPNYLANVLRYYQGDIRNLEQEKGKLMN